MIKNIAFTADSGVLKNMDQVVVIPSCIIDSKGTSYLDQKDITNTELFQRRNRGEKFKTSSPQMSSFLDVFENLLEEYEDVIHFSMSGDISSGSLNAAVQTAKIVNEKRIHVIDTRQGGPGGALVVELAKQMRESGASTKKIIEELTLDLLPRIQTTFLVPNPIGFLESGRNKTSHHVGTIWKEMFVKLLMKRGTKFEVVLKDGKLLQDKMHRYPVDTMYVDFIKQHLANAELEPNLFVFGGTNLSEQHASAIQKFLKTTYPNYEVQEHDMGGVISAYACQDTIGISYVKKRS